MRTLNLSIIFSHFQFAYVLKCVYVENARRGEKKKAKKYLRLVLEEHSNVKERNEKFFRDLYKLISENLEKIVLN